MNCPDFIMELPDGTWTLKHDNSTTVEVLRANTLKWDPSFKTCLDLIPKTRRNVAVDVGAFIGDSTEWLSLEFSKVIAFEPQRDALTCLIHNAKINVDIYPCAAGTGEWIDLDPSWGGNLGARQPKMGHTHKTVKIDDLWLDTLDFLKIDVEGWEPNVLEGAKNTLERCKPIVRVEFNKTALDAAGFTYEDITRYFKGWKSVEVSRYSSEQWDTLYKFE